MLTYLKNILGISSSFWWSNKSNPSTCFHEKLRNNICIVTPHHVITQMTNDARTLKTLQNLTVGILKTLQNLTVRKIKPYRTLHSTSARLWSPWKPTKISAHFLFVIMLLPKKNFWPPTPNPFFLDLQCLKKPFFVILSCKCPKIRQTMKIMSQKRYIFNSLSIFIKKYFWSD